MFTLSQMVDREPAMSGANHYRQITSVDGAQFSADCPHCGTRSVGFVIHDGVAENRPVYEVFAQCLYCKRAIIAVFNAQDFSHFGRDRELLMAIADKRSPVRIFPTWNPPTAPQHTPDEVANYFLQGLNSLPIGSWDAATLMFRKTLDTAMKTLLPDSPPRRVAL